MVRAHIFYSGIVQGVGFRCATQRLARACDVNGWVRNLSDGRVEILAEGSQENIQKMIRHIEDHFCEAIRSEKIDFSDSDGMFADFQISSTG